MEICQSRRVSKRVGYFQCKFRTEGASLTNHCWCQKTRVIGLSCGIKISRVHCLVLSQSTRVTDGRTDRITTHETKSANAAIVGEKVGRSGSGLLCSN